MRSIDGHMLSPSDMDMASGLLFRLVPFFGAFFLSGLPLPSACLPFFSFLSFFAFSMINWSAGCAPSSSELEFSTITSLFLAATKHYLGKSWQRDTFVALRLRITEFLRVAGHCAEAGPSNKQNR